MANILIGVITAILVILACGVCFYVGYRVGYTNKPKEEQNEKTTTNLTKEQQRMAEGFANILNHANRHGAGDKK